MKKEIVFVSDDVRCTLSVDQIEDVDETLIWMEMSDDTQNISMPFRDAKEVDDFIKELQELKILFEVKK